MSSSLRNQHLTKLLQHFGKLRRLLHVLDTSKEPDLGDTEVPGSCPSFASSSPVFLGICPTAMILRLFDYSSKALSSRCFFGATAGAGAARQGGCRCCRLNPDTLCFSGTQALLGSGFKHLLHISPFRWSDTWFSLP